MVSLREKSRWQWLILSGLRYTAECSQLAHRIVDHHSWSGNLHVRHNLLPLDQWHWEGLEVSSVTLLREGKVVWYHDRQ